jgi:uncharacterized protein (TIGR03083 family)
MSAPPPLPFLDIIAAEGARISRLARGGDLSRPVSYLPRWRVRDVVAHLGGVHRWATRIVSEQSMAGPGFRKSPLDGEALCDWFDEGLGALVATFVATDPTAICPNFSPGSPDIAAFWFRRQAHETAMHRWDVEFGLGQVSGFDTAVATDGIDELLHVFVRTRGGYTIEAPVAITCVDSSASWGIAPADKPGRVRVDRGAPQRRAATLQGTATDLLLALWHRVPLDGTGITVTGDAKVAASFVTGPA